MVLLGKRERQLSKISICILNAVLHNVQTNLNKFLCPTNKIPYRKSDLKSSCQSYPSSQPDLLSKIGV